MARHPAGDRGRRAAGLMHGQSRVSSATAFLAQASSTRSLPAAAAAMSAATAALFRALGSPGAPAATASRKAARSAQCSAEAYRRSSLERSLVGYGPG